MSEPFDLDKMLADAEYALSMDEGVCVAVSDEDVVRLIRMLKRTKAALARAPCQRNEYRDWCPDRTRLHGFRFDEWCDPCIARKEQPKGAME